MIEVRHIEAARTRPLRQRVLRPGRELEPDDPRAVHLAAFDGDEVVGTGLVLRDDPPFAYDGPAWRLRGMATDPGRRGEGIGSAVLAAALLHAATEGGRLLWCNARFTARHFYERAGLQAHGEVWEDPAHGPHVVMRVALAAGEVG